ncbi:MAG: TAXI family TRAP transporter solute-binding subunit [Candidimonas sp.]|jgi:TRAP transporter TAXI family solute receptor
MFNSALGRYFRHPALHVAAGIALALSLATPAVAQKKVLAIGTGGMTGVYYAAGGSICRLLNKNRHRHGMRCMAQSTGGSVANAKDIADGKLEFGIVQSDVSYNAYMGLGQFAGSKPYSNLRSLFSLHAEPVTIVVGKKSGIQSFDDLKGKRFNVGGPGSGSRVLIEQYLNARGDDLNYFGQIKELGPDKHGAALCADTIDGFVYGVGHPSANIQEPTTNCGARLLALQGSALDALLKEHAYYAKVVIPGGMYPDNPTDTATYGVMATLIASAEVPEHTVYLVVKSVFDNLPELRTLHAAFQHLKAEDMMTNGLSIPMHPGAIRYFRERGLL